MNLMTHMVQQLTLRPPPDYADIKAREKTRTCVCGETDPNQFYGGKSLCRACTNAKLREWRKAGYRPVRKIKCICGKQFESKHSNAKYCGPVCRNKAENAAKRERGNTELRGRPLADGPA